MFRSLPITLLITTAILAVAAPAASAAATGGGGTGKVHFSDLTMTVSVAKASPLLNLALADGEHFRSVEFTFRAPGETRAIGDDRLQDYYTVTMENVLVSSYQTSAMESLSLNYTKITYSYTPMSDRNGTGKTMAAEVLASALGGANFAFADGSVKFVR